MTTCVISQPRFFPGLHYLHRMLVADIFVILDTVQYTPRHEENRTKLKTAQGFQWLTVPINRTHREQRIADTAIDHSQPWSLKAIKTLKLLYGKAPFYEQYTQEVNSVLETSHGTLSQLNWSSWQVAIRELDISCKFVYASDLPVSGRGSELLFSICRHLQADVYLSGAFGRGYLDDALFSSGGISIQYHEFSYPEYVQRFAPFEPYLSYLDMLFNVKLNRDSVLAGGKLLQE